MPSFQVQIEQYDRPVQVDLPPNAQLRSDEDDRFRVRYVHRAGSNGIVFAADLLDNYEQRINEIAVKFLKQLSDRRRDRFANEVRILKSLDCIEISTYYGSGTEYFPGGDVQIPWMAMDLYGKNLRESIHQSGALAPEDVIVVGTQICNAAEYLHNKEIIHRDIKPANFVWAWPKDEASRDIRMIDLGIAKYLGENVAGRPLDQFTQMKEFVGPQSFSSPELIAYAEDKAVTVDHRSDLYQIGMNLWFLATGTICSANPSKKLDPFDGRLRELVLDLLSQDPDDRPQNAGEIRGVLRTL